VDFNRIYKKYKDAVYNYVFWRVYSEEDAIDITQEVFVKVYKGLANFKGKSSLKTWIFAIAHNTTINYLSRKKYREEDIENYFLSEEPLKNIRTKTMVLKAIEKLTDEHREVIKLYYFDGFSYKEIANLLNISIGTVKSRLNRAKEHLKEELEGIYGK